MDLLVQAPPEHVEVMHTVVPGIRCRSLPEEVPALVEAVEVKGTVRRGAEVQVSLHSPGHGRLLHVADAGPPSAAVRLRAVGVTESAVSNESLY